MNCVRKTLALLAAVMVLLMTGTALAGSQYEAPADKVDLIAMWTYNGVVLRWQAVPETAGYTVCRRSGKGAYTKLYAAGPGETYYLDASISSRDGVYTYQVEVALGGVEKQTILSDEVEVNVWYDWSNALLPPSGVKVEMGPYGPVISWMEVEEAQFYMICRRSLPDGVSVSLGWMEDTSFIDYAAKPDKLYGYQVISLNSDHASMPNVPAMIRVSKTEPLPKAQADAPPKDSLVLEGYGYKNTSRTYPWLMPMVVNQSIGRVITAFEMTFYCEDSSGGVILQKDTGEKYYTQRYLMTLGPGEAVYPHHAWLYGYEDVTRVYAAVTSITFADETVVDIPKKERVFFYWAVK